MQVAGHGLPDLFPGMDLDFAPGVNVSPAVWRTASPRRSCAKRPAVSPTVRSWYNTTHSAKKKSKKAEQEEELKNLCADKPKLFFNITQCRGGYTALLKQYSS
jgi:hypothetical protein